MGTGTSSVSNVKCLRSEAGAWSNVYKSKKQGGLDIKDIKDQNIALLGKWLWKSLNDDVSHWVKPLKDGLFRTTLERLDGKPLDGSSIFVKEYGNVMIA